MSKEIDELKARVAALDRELATLKGSRVGAGPGIAVRRTIRLRSSTVLFGWPLYEIAIGPDPDTGEFRGHARAIFAIGDVATGFVAFGGIARGIVAIGGLAVGLVSLGGFVIGLGLVIGGVAVGTIALGGATAGFVAGGGVAIGYYAFGGLAVGRHVIDATTHDPFAIQFFSKWLPGFNQLFPQAPLRRPPGVRLPRRG